MSSPRGSPRSEAGSSSSSRAPIRSRCSTHRRDWQGSGRALRGYGRRNIMLLAHMDTVYARGTLAKRPFRVEGDKAYGPGIADDKGGVAVVLHTLTILKALGFRDYRILTVIVNGDEEVSTPARAISSRASRRSTTSCSRASRRLRPRTSSRSPPWIGAATIVVHGARPRGMQRRTGATHSSSSRTSARDQGSERSVERHQVQLDHRARGTVRNASRISPRPTPTCACGASRTTTRSRKRSATASPESAHSRHQSRSSFERAPAARDHRPPAAAGEAGAGDLRGSRQAARVDDSGKAAGPTRPLRAVGKPVVLENFGLMGRAAQPGSRICRAGLHRAALSCSRG